MTTKPARQRILEGISQSEEKGKDTGGQKEWISVRTATSKTSQETTQDLQSAREHLSIITFHVE